MKDDPIPTPDGAEGEVTRLLALWSSGDASALERLAPLVYEELRTLAGRLLRGERAGHTLQPTALVNEAFLRLAGGRTVDWKGRTHFFAVAARAMRRILVDHARTRLAGKRGGGATRISLTETPLSVPAPDVDVLALDEALERLAGLDPGQARVVELRFFAGLSVEETAEAIGASPATVKREWSSARAWLFRELGGTA